MRTIHFNSNKNQQRTQELVVSDNRVVIRTRTLVDVGSVLTEIPGLSVYLPYLQQKDTFPESRVYIYEIEGYEDAAALRDELKLLVRAADHPQIEYIGSVLKYADSGIYQIYTGNMFIKLDGRYGETRTDQFLRTHKLKLKQRLPFSKNAFFVEPTTDPGRGVFEMAEEFLQASQVQMCHPELVVRRKAVFETVDIQTSLLTAHENWVYDRVKLFDAWKLTRGKGATICVIDDGLDFMHPAFSAAGKIPSFRDMHDRGSGRKPGHQFTEAHGTACAGIAASTDPRAIGIAPDARLIPIRSIGLGSVLESEAFSWAADNGADIISCSWGPPDGDFRVAGAGPAAEFPIPDHTDLAIRYAAEKGRKGKGSLIFFAAGNGNERVVKDHYASHEDVMAIGATNQDDKKAVYSDHGNPLFCCFPSGDYDNATGKWTQVSGVTVADRVGDAGYIGGDIYHHFTGTSASCPGMAGIAALALSVAPNLTAVEARKIFSESCKTLGTPSHLDKQGRHPDFGYGLIQADKVVKNCLKFNNKSTNLMSNTNANPKALSLHIGLDNVSPEYYKDHIAPLFGCVNDKNRMLALAKSIGFQHTSLENAEATRDNILARLHELADAASPGDLVLITYAGHGAPIEDFDGDEDDGNDEAWVTYNGFLLDDELYRAWGRFKEGVRVLIVSDSCHSGTMARALMASLSVPEGVPTGSRRRWINPAIVKKVLKEHATSKADLKSRGGTGDDVDVVASVKLLAACQDDQYAFEIDGGGMFTTYLLEVYQEYKDRAINYQTFLDYIVKRMPAGQRPKLTSEGAANPDFDRQRPFSVLLSELTDSPAPEISSTPKPIEPPARSVDPPAILLETRASFIPVDAGLNTRATRNTPSSLKVVNSLVRGMDVAGKHPWDKAYNLILADQERNIEFAEPDLTSNINGTEDTFGERGLSRGKLPTYPPYHDVAFDWHLDIEHSQLKAARETVFPNLITGEPVDPDTRLVKVVHIDTGYIPDHPAHPDNLRYSMSVSMGAGGVVGDAIDDDAKYYPSEQNGHGNATMALLAGGELTHEHTGGKFNGYFGAIPFAQVYSIKISETVILLKGSRFAQAIDFAIEVGADVITMSMAGWPSKVIADAVNRAYEAGIVVVSAGGNSWVKGGTKLLPDSILYPARFERTIAAVGATYDHTPYVFDLHNRKARAEGGQFMQMSYGPPSAMKTAIAAYTPNVIWFGKDGRGVEKYYTEDGGGTSSATPQVAAAAALYLQHHRVAIQKIAGNQRWKRVEIVKEALFSTAKTWEEKPDESETYYGNGIIQALDALQVDPGSIRISKAKEAKAKGGFFKKLFGLFKTRGLDLSGHDRIQEMMNLELMQLMYREPELYDYLGHDFDQDSHEFSPKDQQRIVDVVRNSKHASEYLKTHIISSGISTSAGGTRSAEISGEGYNDMLLPGQHHNLLLRTNGLKCSGTRFKPSAHHDDATGTTIDEVEVDIEYQSTRSTNVSLSLATDFEARGRQGFMLVEREVDGQTVIDFVMPNGGQQSGSLARSYSGTRSAQQLDGEFSIALPTGVNEVTRGPLQGKVGKMLFKVISWAKPNGKDGKEQFESFLSTHYNYKYEVVVYDLKAANGTWVALDQAVKDHINGETKPVMICMPGLASTVASGFDEFFANSEVRKSITRKYCRYALGFNMPTIVDSVEKNAAEFSKLLKGTFDKKTCSVLARSRGGILARYLFEREWVNNNTGQPIAKAPFVLNKLVMVGTPNEGTPIADEDKWKGLVKVMANVLGAVVAVGPVGLPIIKVITAAIDFAVDLDGINDLQLESAVIARLNEKAGVKKNYYSGISNYEPRGFKKVLDALFVDRHIFGRKNMYRKKLNNDSVVPVLSALGRLSKDGIEIPKKNQKFAGSPKKGSRDSVSHFAYLETENADAVDPKGDEFVAWVLGVL